MLQTVEAIYDGKVLRPKRPLDLKPNTNVRITIETRTKRKKDRHFLDTIESLNLQGPPDWAENIGANKTRGYSPCNHPRGFD